MNILQNTWTLKSFEKILGTRSHARTRRRKNYFRKHKVSVLEQMERAGELGRRGGRQTAERKKHT
jgi:hypothetical protein